MPPSTEPHVVIVGAGFGGLACAKRLGGAPIRVTIIDRRNYHLFVPLLYQVATAALSPADIAQPIRRMVSRYRNIDVVLGDVRGIDVAAREVLLADRTHRLRPPRHRHRLDLQLFRSRRMGGGGAGAEEPRGRAEHPGAPPPLLRAGGDLRPTRRSRRSLLTTIIVGGGPTGVEMAGAVAELTRHSLRRDFRRIDPTRARILLVEAGPRLLPAFARSRYPTTPSARLKSSASR